MVKIRISKSGSEKLEEIMAELEVERADALRIAFAKGLVESEKIHEREKVELASFEIPLSVIAKPQEMVLIKHLIIDKLNSPIDDDDIEKYIIACIEQGIEIMSDEIKKLTVAENYFYYLLNKHNITNA